MKKIKFFNLSFVLFFVFSLAFVACNKEEITDTTPANERIDGYRFSKELNLTDEFGNTAKVVVSTNTESRLEGIETESLEFVVTKELPQSNLVNNNNQEEETTETFDWYAHNVVFIDVVEHNIGEEFVGFRVDMKKDKNAASLRWDWNETALGADGVRGVSCDYTFESCSNNSSRLKLDLDKKTSSWNLAWQNLSAATLYNAGESFSYCSNTGWNRYRFRGDFQKCGNGVQTATWFWRIGC